MRRVISFFLVGVPVHRWIYDVALLVERALSLGFLFLVLGESLNISVTISHLVIEPEAKVLHQQWVTNKLWFPLGKKAFTSTCSTRTSCGAAPNSITGTSSQEKAMRGVVDMCQGLVVEQGHEGAQGHELGQTARSTPF